MSKVGGKKIVPTERQTQRAIVDMAALCFPSVIVHHSPNQNNKRGWGGKIAAINNRKDGVVTGWPDLLFLWGAGNAAFAEIKRPGRASAVSDAQRGILDKLMNYGFPTAVLTGPETAYQWLYEIGAPRAREFVS